MGSFQHIATGLAIGLAAGTAIGMLTAPKRGQEMREHLKHKAEEARTKAKQQMASRGGDAISQARQALDKLEQQSQASAS